MLAIENKLSLEIRASLNFLHVKIMIAEHGFMYRISASVPLRFIGI